jgi:DNA-binding NtrC family response regulator
MDGSRTPTVTDTILVIDDEAFMLDLVRRILERGSYRVITARTADEGLAAYVTEHPVLVITDLIMPDKDGLEVIKELRQVEPSVKILAISGGGSTGYTNALKAAQAFGAQETLRKPFAPNVLLDAVARVLGRPALKLVPKPGAQS